MVLRAYQLLKISFVAVFFLILYSIFLTYKHITNTNCPSSLLSTSCPSPKNHFPPLPFSFDVSLNLSRRLCRWDDRHLYQLFDHIITGALYAPLSATHLTCLATQASLKRLAHLVAVTAHWSGSISFAAFAASDAELEALLLAIFYLRRCNAAIRHQVAFHLAVPPRIRSNRIDYARLKTLSCAHPTQVLLELAKEAAVAEGDEKQGDMLYPQNHLRNLARKNCQSRYVFLTDVDIVPSRGMAEALDGFLKTATCKGGRCAYVIPTYELDESVKFPKNKRELVHLANNGLARQFHYKVFITNQFATNFNKWQSSLNNRNEVHVSHSVTNYELYYEPFYVALDTVPPHDERFVGYGFTKASQIYEMYVAGYEFLVLSPIFTCHWGQQELGTRLQWRDDQNNVNRIYFDKFKREISAKYNKYQSIKEWIFG